MYQQASTHLQPVMNYPAVPHPMLQPTSGEQAPTVYSISPMQQHMITPIHNHPSEGYTS